MNEQLLNKEDTYIVGVSGGVDSMSLLDMLRVQGYQVIVCHINYHFRHDSNVDQQIVEEYCKKYTIPCFVKEVEKSEYTKDNFQMQAREIRYSFYQETGVLFQTNKVLLAHHQDDVIETIYMQLERKNIKGYLGIKEISKVKAMDIYRPLLSYSKESLYRYCKENTVLYHEDYTNFETEFTRDYVRNIVLPTFTSSQKEILLKKATMHNQRYLEQEKKRQDIYQEYRKNGYIKYTTLDKQQVEAVIYYLLMLVVYPPDISDSLIQECYKQIHSDKPNVMVNLPVNAVFIKEYDNIYVLRKYTKRGYCLKYQSLVYDKHDYFYLSDTGHLNEGIALTKKDFPITIRTYQKGDSIVTHGGTKKVSRLFIDYKIPKNQRDIWPIVVRFDGTILLIPHIAKNIGYLYTKPNVFVLKYKDLRSEINA